MATMNIRIEFEIDKWRLVQFCQSHVVDSVNCFRVNAQKKFQDTVKDEAYKYLGIL